MAHLTFDADSKGGRAFMYNSTRNTTRTLVHTSLALAPKTVLLKVGVAGSHDSS